MEIHLAMTLAAQRAKWSPAHIAAAAGSSEQTARRWMTGVTTIPGDKLMILRQQLPQFAQLLDHGDQEAVA